jgi:hypothetical protein
MVSRDSIILGLSSASIAATESQFSLSSESSSRSSSLIVPRAAVSLPSVFLPADWGGITAARFPNRRAGLCLALPVAPAPHPQSPGVEPRLL